MVSLQSSLEETVKGWYKGYDLEKMPNKHCILLVMKIIRFKNIQRQYYKMGMFKNQLMIYKINFLKKIIGLLFIFLLQKSFYIFEKCFNEFFVLSFFNWGMWCEVAQSCPTLCDPMECSPPSPSIHGIFQARKLECVAISFSIIEV